MKKPYLYTDGTPIKKGDKVTTWGTKTVYEIDEIGDDLFLKGIKALSSVSCIPVKVLTT